MFAPDDRLAPNAPVFDEPWQAQTLALADSMVNAGHFSATDWAETLGDELRKATAAKAPDTADTYYRAALAGLERLAANAGISDADRAKRTADWRRAYLNTPHGKPVSLPD